MRPKTAQIILSGDELITGFRRDLIGPQLANRLESLGCELESLEMLPDDVTLIARHVEAAVDAGVDVVVICGGLGPTEDDCTREGVAVGLGLELEIDEGSLERIEARYRERGRDIPGAARRQALRPAGAQTIPNPIGTAPGFMSRKSRTLVVALPGVPRECNEMFARGVSPMLKETFAGAMETSTAVLRVSGLAESEVHRRISELVPNTARRKVKYLAHPGEVTLLVNSRAADKSGADEQLHESLVAIRGALGDHVYGEGDTTLVGLLRDLLLSRGWSLGTAESCTGGLLGKTITDLPGSSAFYLGGVIAYDNREKRNLLDVPEQLLERCGAVSSEVARAMASGCRTLVGASMALAVTGIAGPDGGSADKPVGLVYLAVATPERNRVFRHTFTGDRESVRRRAALAALDEARRALAGLSALGREIEPDERAAARE